MGSRGPTLLTSASIKKIPLQCQDSIELCIALSKAKINPQSWVQAMLNEERLALDKALHKSELEFKKYLIDLKIALTVDKKLREFLKSEADKKFEKHQIAKESLLHTIELKRKEAEERFLIDANLELLESEKQKLIESLNEQISVLDGFMLDELDKCHQQIQHLEARRKDIKHKRTAMVEHLKTDLVNAFDRPENLLNGKNILAGTPENQAGFVTELLDNHEELSAVEEEISQLVSDEVVIDTELRGAEQNASEAIYEYTREAANHELDEESLDEDEDWEYSKAKEMLEGFDIESVSEEDMEMYARLEEEDEQEENELKSDKSGKEIKIEKKLSKIEQKEEDMRQKIRELRELKEQRLQQFEGKKEYINAKKAEKGKNKGPMTLALKRLKLKEKKTKLSLIDKEIEELRWKKKEVKEKKEVLSDRLQGTIAKMAEKHHMDNMFDKDPQGNKFVSNESVRNLLDTSRPMVKKVKPSYDELAEQDAQCALHQDELRAYARQIYDDGKASRAAYQAKVSKLGGGRSHDDGLAAIDALYAKTQARQAQGPDNTKKERMSSTS